MELHTKNRVLAVAIGLIALLLYVGTVLMQLLAGKAGS
jgi:uncharacterized membrane protein (DUF485 family)